MDRNFFNIVGWLILLGMGISWVWIGYSSWYLLLLPLAYLSFSIKDGSITKLGKIKQLSISQITRILFAFIASVVLVLVLIQLANYLINDLLHLTGVLKTISVVIAIIVSLYPIKFTFGSIVYRVVEGGR